jgi:preprotein translocase subunit SecA
VERDIMLQIVDQQWKDHLYSLDHLKEGIGLRGYGQRDPLIEYKKESFGLFQEMLERIQDRVVKVLWKIELAGREENAAESQRVERSLPIRPPKQQLTFSGAPKEAPAPVKRQQAKVGRNDPCPCGSGKKYKKCHGTAA